LALPAFRKKEAQHKNQLILLLMLILSAPVYATLLSIIAGHTISFQPAYGIFAAPYVMILIAAGFENLIASNYKMIYKAVLPVGFLAIISVSLFLRYSFNSRTYSNSLSNPIIGLVDKIKQETINIDTVAYSSYEDAVITNIYLPSDKNIVQIIDTNLNDMVMIKNSRKILFDFENGK
jgi:hypothetical protein